MRSKECNFTNIILEIKMLFICVPSISLHASFQSFSFD